MQDFRLRRGRQLLAIASTLIPVLSLALLHRHPDLFGEFSKDAIFTAQVVVIAAFIGFSAFNWRCPSCKKYLGKDVNKVICKKCGTRFR